MFGVLSDKIDLDSFAPARLRERVQKARHDAFVARTESTVRLYSLSVDGLERAQELLDRVPKPVAQPLRRVVDGGLDQVTRMPVADYEALNVKKVAEAIEGLSLIDLERVVRYERANKDRKTVYRHVDRERQRLLGQSQAV
jgi:hypothetical protein